MFKVTIHRLHSYSIIPPSFKLERAWSDCPGSGGIFKWSGESEGEERPDANLSGAEAE